MTINTSELLYLSEENKQLRKCIDELEKENKENEYIISLLIAKLEGYKPKEIKKLLHKVCIRCGKEFKHNHYKKICLDCRKIKFLQTKKENQDVREQN